MGGPGPRARRRGYERHEADMNEGYWERDNSHFPIPMSRYLWGLFVPAYDEGTRRGLARYGCVLDHFEFRRFKGRLYIQSCPVASPDEIAERRVAAEHAMATKLWREDRAYWPSIAHSLRERLLVLARRNPSNMDLPELRAHIAAVRSLFLEGTTQHFVQQPSSMVPVGDWVLRTCEWTGASPSEVVAVLQGSCRHSDDYLQSIDDLTDVLRGNTSAMALVRDNTPEARIRLERLHAVSPAIAELLGTYLDEYSDRIVTGFDITDATLRELPQFTLSLINSRIDSPRESTGIANDVLEVEAKLRERVPEAVAAEFDEALTEAKAAYGLHDDDVRIAYLWPLGLIRRALLAGATRLVDIGALYSVDHIFQATPDEADALMAGSGSPSASEFQQRADEWEGWAADEPPSTIGEKQPGFTNEELGWACARVSAAIQFYLSEMEAGVNRSRQPSWSVLVEGLAASPGRYEGRARIVCGPADFAKLAQGDVLVARTTSPAYNVILPTIGAVVTDRGGSLCHAAIIAREFGIPAVVGTNDATVQIPDGAQILVDGDRGFVAVCL
jgi:phosphohistidine swiveling domain-containing protein